MDPIKKWWVEEKVKKAIEKLGAHDFKSTCVRTKEEAGQEIWKQIAPGQRIGWVDHSR